MLSTNQKGAISESVIACEAIKLGIGVYKPLTDLRADFIFEIGDDLVRVQCKTALIRGQVVVVPCYSARRTRDGLVRRLYSPDEIEAYAAFCPENGKCYYLPIELFPGRSQIQLRLAPALNGQRARINWAREYEFGTMLGATAA